MVQYTTMVGAAFNSVAEVDVRQEACFSARGENPETAAVKRKTRTAKSLDMAIVMPEKERHPTTHLDRTTLCCTYSISSWHLTTEPRHRGLEGGYDTHI